MYTIEELVQLKQAGFTAEEIMNLSKGDTPVPKEEPKPEPTPEPAITQDGVNELLEAFKQSMNEQMEAFKQTIQLSNVNRDSSELNKATVQDVVAQIIRPNGSRKE